MQLFIYYNNNYYFLHIYFTYTVKKDNCSIYEIDENKINFKHLIYFAYTVKKDNCSIYEN